jgi:xanthine dehydrogenase YagS FAD-binding subunit
MNPFTYISADSPQTAIAQRSGNADSAFLAGGTNLIDDMKLGVEHPGHLIDVSRLALAEIAPLPGGGLRVGAMVRNSDLAWDARVRDKYPVLSMALLSGASPQLRNLATTGGNLLQRTRCYYFRDVHCPCNKRDPGSGCSAIDGYNRIHAVLGTSRQCIATHPSDMCVAMAALDAVVRVQGPGGERTIPIGEFHVPYGDDPAKENNLQPGELITAVDLPATPWFARSTYVKVRDRASYEFALASAAVALEIKDGVIVDARIALGGVATKPWRALAAEAALKGQKPETAVFVAAAAAELKPAVAQKDNGFKIELAKRTIVRALSEVVS